MEIAATQRAEAGGPAPTRGMFIDGRFTAGEGEPDEVRNPATHTVLATVPRGRSADVDTAVRAARGALEGAWGRVPPAGRGRILARLAELVAEVGLPEGVVNVLTGDGDTGRAIVEHPGIAKIAFTGSTEVGRSIGETAGRMLKRVTLELGGKSPNIILPDADLERAIPGSFQGIYFNTGQACNAGSRTV